MNVLSKIKDRARKAKRRVVLPEGTEPRAIQAAKKIVSEEIGSVTLLGDQKEIEKLAGEHGLNLGKMEIVNPAHGKEFNRFVADLVELRKHKGLTEDQARTLMMNPLYYGAMMVRHDIVHASVAGSVNTTGDVLRAAIHVLGLAEGIKVVSSCFLMSLPKFGEELDKPFMFGDCAVVPNPTAEELASIAASTAGTMKSLLDIEPKVAMLSFSTKGSARHADVEKVTKALDILKQEHPDIKADGEMQLDAAVIASIGKRKAPDSEIAGQANVLIFPDLDAGNIGYKLTERFAGASATGPIIQGLAKPANDLSRGCSAEDIVNVSAIAMLMRG
ncbi:phosphate acetyltransferase [candidate division GN15 bacterium]|nr:phosphate acetyltransferase [candidate division GN15 bacterium]